MPGAAADADVIVVGAGAGGLTTAAYLAALGRRVIVVDRQAAPGGNTSSFTHDGYEFDIGLHYLGGYGDARPGIRAALDPLGVELRFREQDRDGFDVLMFEDMTFPVPAGVEQFRARLHEFFPRERTAIDRYLNKIVAVTDQFEARVPSRAGELPQYAWRTRDAMLACATTLGREFNRLGCSPRLRTVLGYLWGTYSVPPARAALAVHALVTGHYLRGAWYPEGGARSVSGALVDVIEQAGGELLLDTDVSRIMVRGGAVHGVQLEAGPGGTVPRSRELHADTVVSAIDIKRTFLELLAPGEVPARWRQRVRGFTMAAPLFIVYVVLDRDLHAEGVSNCNWSVIDCDDIDSLAASYEAGQLPSQRWAWITSASLKDPGNPRLCRPGQTNLQIVTGAPARHDFWDVGPDLARGRRYQERKQQLRDRALQASERAIPGISDAIAYEESASPITLERFLRSTGGTSYGIAATPRQFGIARPGPRTPINGLFLAGASTRTGHGITGTMLGGIETASAIIGERADQVVSRHRTQRTSGPQPPRLVPVTCALPEPQRRSHRSSKAVGSSHAWASRTCGSWMRPSRSSSRPSRTCAVVNRSTSASTCPERRSSSCAACMILVRRRGRSQCHGTTGSQLRSAGLGLETARGSSSTTVARACGPRDCGGCSKRLASTMPQFSMAAGRRGGLKAIQRPVRAARIRPRRSRQTAAQACLPARTTCCRRSMTRTRASSPRSGTGSFAVSGANMAADAAISPARATSAPGRSWTATRSATARSTNCANCSARSSTPSESSPTAAAASASASVAFVLHVLGHPNVAVYDGGLIEWSADRRLPLVTGDELAGRAG